jgi:hypothetical protein
LVFAPEASLDESTWAHRLISPAGMRAESESLDHWVVHMHAETEEEEEHHHNKHNNCVCAYRIRHLWSGGARTPILARQWRMTSPRSACHSSHTPHCLACHRWLHATTTLASPDAQAPTLRLETSPRSSTSALWDTQGRCG